LAEDGIRDFHVTGVQTCALPILGKATGPAHSRFEAESFDFATADFAAYQAWSRERVRAARIGPTQAEVLELLLPFELPPPASCRSEERRVGKGFRCRCAPYQEST